MRSADSGLQFSSRIKELRGIERLHAALADTLNNLHLFPDLDETSQQRRWPQTLGILVSWTYHLREPSSPANGIEPVSPYMALDEEPALHKVAPHIVCSEDMVEPVERHVKRLVLRDVDGPTWEEKKNAKNVGQKN